MGTDARATLEVMQPPAGHAAPLRWAEFTLLRDYVLFDLIAGARAEDPTLAVVPIRPFAWRAGGEVDLATTELSADDLAVVDAAYQARTGRRSAQLAALRAAMQAFEADAAGATRLRIWFF